MKRIFLTGASSGIGLATAKLLAERGDEVWGTSRDIARLPQWPNLRPVRLDLGDLHSLGQSFDAALKEAGHFDVVINNAGSGHFGPGEFLNVDAVRQQFQTVVFAHITVVNVDTVQDDVALAVVGDRIAAIGPTDALLERFRGADVYDGRGKGSGVRIEGRFWYLFKLRNGKLLSWRLYPERAQALEAAGLAE